MLCIHVIFVPDWQMFHILRLILNGYVFSEELNTPINTNTIYKNQQYEKKNKYYFLSVENLGCDRQ